MNADTKLCISVSAKPSNIGMSIHNAGYSTLELNYFYKACSIQGSLEDLISAIICLKIKGCSISQPYKEQILKNLNKIEEAANIIGAVNTILNEDGILMGFNTDYIGAKKVIESLNCPNTSSVLVLGAGGVARAILFALNQLGFSEIFLSNRSPNRAKSLNNLAKLKCIQWEKRSQIEADIVINATSIGMNENDSMPIDIGVLKSAKAIIDVIAFPVQTELVKIACGMGKVVVPGYLMAFEQAVAQFEIYTGRVAPRDEMFSALKKILNIK
jgi:shikimate dehydrogenase